MRVLITGAHGMLGTDLVAMAPPGVDVIATDREQLDLLDDRAVAQALADLSPEWVINASAYTAVDRAEADRDAAFAINATAVGALGRECAARGIRVVHYSTDYVFAGNGSRPYREDDVVAPLNAYGESKLAGERALSESGAHSIVLRTQWLFGVHGKSFPRTMWERAIRQQPTRVVNDQVGRPTFTVDLASATWELVAAEGRGTYHAANSGAATWFELAKHVFRAAGADALLSACTTADYPTPARRPSYSVLDTTRLDAVLTDGALPSWQNAVDRFLEFLRIENTP